MQKIAYLGMGAWGYCLASLLAGKGYEVVCWTTQSALVYHMMQHRQHPLFPNQEMIGNMTVTNDLAEALNKAEIIVESVTSAGLRSVLEQARAIGMPLCPLILTSKGIEQDTGLLLPEVAVEVLGELFRPFVGVLSGPSFAQEVIRKLPTSVVASSYAEALIPMICRLFTTPYFRIYPNTDIAGVALGGALKNVIAIACGISDGLAFGQSAKAALMTRGLHEMRKLAIARRCRGETLNGLSGMGDLCLTCNSSMSRNFRFGNLLASGLSVSEAQHQIGMVVEGAYTCLSAIQIGSQLEVPLPIAETVHHILEGRIHPLEAVNRLMQRTIKEEVL